MAMPPARTQVRRPLSGTASSAPRRPRRGARTVEELIAAGALPETARAGAERAAALFRVAVSPETLDLIAGRDALDPIAVQYLPSPRETMTAGDEIADPIGDRAFSPLPGLVHRHPDRVLLKPTLACAVHCRFCFRREDLDAPQATMDEQALDAAAAYIRAHDEVREVILTGGDPFVLAPKRLAQIVRRIETAPHVDVVRVHTRVPIAAPSRITPSMVRALRGRATPYVVVHCNHARELTPAARAACAAFVDAGIPVLAQSVLLRGVNDTVEALAELCEALVRARIKPYYLHHADLVRGASHFRTSIAEGRALTAALRRRLSGLAMPTYVLDVPGGHGKVPLERERWSEGAQTIEDPAGRRHPYPPRPPRG